MQTQIINRMFYGGNSPPFLYLLLAFWFLLLILKSKKMDKQLFIEAIDAIRQQCEFDIEVSKNLGKAFPEAFEANLLPKNHFLQNALLKVLQTEMNDIKNVESGASWIEYFCWELNFGKENYRLRVYTHGNEVPMSNAAELYDFLNNR